MIELKFRAYHKEHKKMFEVFSFCKYYIKVKIENSDTAKDKIENFEPLMQFVNLRDKNNKQYCQDDIVCYRNKNYRLIFGTYSFELLGFCEHCQDVPCDFFSEDAYLHAEIIGNVYENPELLTNKK